MRLYVAPNKKIMQIPYILLEDNFVTGREFIDKLGIKSTLTTLKGKKLYEVARKWFVDSAPLRSQPDGQQIKFSEE